MVGAREAWTAGAPDPNKPVKACASRTGVKVIAAKAKCPRGTKLVTWNLRGPRGVTGVFGVQLSGADGVACTVSDGGAAGTVHLQFNSETGVEEFVCS